MAKTYPVKWYTESMQGAPQTGDTDPGALAAILKACMVTGFGNIAVDTLTWDATLSAAKATISAGHSYLKDSVIDVTGSDVATYNGEHRIVQVSSTEVWFELDEEPAGPSTSAVSMKIAPLGWEITHEDGTGQILILKPVADIGNVSLRIDNSAFTGWSGTSYLAKVAMIENVVDIDSYDTIYEHRWPATGRYSGHKWDLIGDSRFFFWFPEYGAAKRQGGFVGGYIDTIRAGDRYHFIMNSVASTNASDGTYNLWSYASTSRCYTYLARNFTANNNVIARKYHQIEGTTGWMKSGLRSYNSDVMLLPNPVDNGFYINTDPAMVIESDGAYRGTLPIMVFPLANNANYNRKNLQDLPDFHNKIFRMLMPTYDEGSSLAGVLTGFDISTVEV